MPSINTNFTKDQHSCLDIALYPTLHITTAIMRILFYGQFASNKIKGLNNYLIIFLLQKIDNKSLNK